MENLLVSCFLVNGGTLNQAMEEKEAGGGVKGADNFLNILINKMGDGWPGGENQQILMFLQSVDLQVSLQRATDRKGSDSLTLTGQGGSPLTQNVVGALLDALGQRTNQAPQEANEGNESSSFSFLSFLQGGYLLYTGSADVLLKGQTGRGTDGTATPPDKVISDALLSDRAISDGAPSDSALSDTVKSDAALSDAVIKELSEEKKGSAPESILSLETKNDPDTILSFLQGGYLLYTGSADVLLKGQTGRGTDGTATPPDKVISDAAIKDGSETKDSISIFRGKNQKGASGEERGQLESSRKESSVPPNAQETARNEFTADLRGTGHKGIDTHPPVGLDDLRRTQAESEERMKVAVVSRDAKPPMAAETEHKDIEAVHEVDADVSVKRDVYQFTSHDDALKAGRAQEKEAGQVMGKSAFASDMVEKIEKLVDRFAQRDTSMDMVVRLRIDEKESLLVGLKEKGQTVTVQVKSGNEGLINLLQSSKEIITRQLEEKNIYAKIWVNPDGEGGFEKRERRENRDGFSRQKDKGSEDFSSQFASFA